MHILWERTQSCKALTWQGAPFLTHSCAYLLLHFNIRVGYQGNRFWPSVNLKLEYFLRGSAQRKELVKWFLKNTRIWYTGSHGCISAMSHSKGSAPLNGAQYLRGGPWQLSLSPFRNDNALPPSSMHIQMVDVSLYTTKNMILKEFNF